MIDFNLDEIDELQMYFGEDYIINDKIKIHQPLIGEIIDYGERSYFSTIHTICAIPSDVKSQLWDLGIDWNEIESFDLFILFSQTLTLDQTSLIFGDLDFQKLKPYPNQANGEVVLADKETGVIIDKLIYLRIVNYIRKLHGIVPKPEKAKGKMAKKAMIDEDRRNIEFNQNKPYKSYLMPLISAVKVKQKYTKEYIRNMGIKEFFDDLARISIIDTSSYLMMGSYCGMADLSKVPRKEFNWLRELD